MFAEEWPLMTFTLFTQLAVGSFFMLALVRTLITKGEEAEANRWIQLGVKTAGGFALIGLILSLFHLGTPLGAYRSILNLGSSWLSREIITAGGFFVLLLITYSQLRKGSFNKVLAWITAIVGLLAIYSMASIYAGSIRPAWDNFNTYVAFYGTTFLFGSVGATLLLLIGKKEVSLSAESLSALKKASFFALAAAIIPLIYLPLYLSSLNGGGSAAAASAQMLTGSYAFPLAVRWILSLGGAGLLTYFIMKLGKKQAGSFNMLYLAFGAVLLGEFIGRYVFYASAVSIMIGLQ